MTEETHSVTSRLSIGIIDAAYHWLVIAMERADAAQKVREAAVAAGGVRGGKESWPGEFHATMGAVTASAFSLEALGKETLRRLRADHGSQKWWPPELKRLRQQRKGKSAAWEDVLLTLEHAGIVDVANHDHWAAELKWLFDSRNRVAHFDYWIEEKVQITPGHEVVARVLGYLAESAVRASEIAATIVGPTRLAVADWLRDERPKSPHFEARFGRPGHDDGQG